MIGAQRAVAKAIAVAVGTFLGVGVLTDLVPTPLFTRMVPRAPIDYAFLSLTAVLAGVYVYQRSTRSDCDGDRCAYGGAAAGFFAVACPPCNAVLVALIGSSAALAYVDPLRPAFGAVGVALLGGVVAYRAYVT